jgi:hypothetical protein
LTACVRIFQPLRAFIEFVAERHVCQSEKRPERRKADAAHAAA